MMPPPPPSVKRLVRLGGRLRIRARDPIGSVTDGRGGFLTRGESNLRPSKAPALGGERRGGSSASMRSIRTKSPRRVEAEAGDGALPLGVLPLPARVDGARVVAAADG